MFKELLSASSGSDSWKRFEKAICALFIGIMFLLFLRSVLMRYRLFPWFNLPLGWDPIMYVMHAKHVMENGIVGYLLSSGRFSVYSLSLILLGYFFDVAQVEIFLPVLLLIVYSLISFLIVYRGSDSPWLAASSIFLTLFNIRGSKFLGLFHANILALIFFLSFIYLLLNNEEYLWGYRDYLVIIFFFLVPLSHPFTSVFMLATLPIILLLNLPILKMEIKNITNLMNHVILSIFSASLVLALNFNYIFSITIGAVNRDTEFLTDPWFHMTEVGDYLFIFNDELISLIIIVLCNLYLVAKSRGKLWLSYISVFSLLTLLFPLTQLVIPLHIPPNRITLLNQYQVLIPLALYYLQEDLGTVRVKLNSEARGFGLTSFIKIFSIIVLIYLAITSWSIYGPVMELDMIPWINEDQYDGLVSIVNYREDHPNEDLIIVYNPDSPGFFRIHQAYSKVLLGESYFYIGRLDDAIKLIPPEELDYLNKTDYKRAINLYYTELRPLSTVNDSNHTLVMIRDFTLAPISKGSIIGENVAIIKLEGYRDCP